MQRVPLSLSPRAGLSHISTRGFKCSAAVGSFQATELYRRNPILSALIDHSVESDKKIAISHVNSGNCFSYTKVLDNSVRINKYLSNENPQWSRALREIIEKPEKAGDSDSEVPPSARESNYIPVALMGENSFEFATAFFGCLSLPHTLAVPLCTKHTDKEIAYVLNHSGARIVITTARFEPRLKEIVAQHVDPARGVSVVKYEDAAADSGLHRQASVPVVPSSGLMLYTSGTSGQPKGVLTPLPTFMAQAAGLAAAWNFGTSTNILHTLPLHHIHGILNALTVPLTKGGTVNFLFPFDPQRALGLLANTEPLQLQAEHCAFHVDPINTYTAVPTIYTRLISTHGKLDESAKAHVTAGLRENLRLAMCGSAALPAPLRTAWDSVSGGKVPLLERYGMTETGITLTQPLDVPKRKNGSVGGPVPGVVARVVDSEAEKAEEATELYRSDHEGASEDVTGELQISGPTVFTKYFNNPAATAEAFVLDAEGTRWFRTGDIVRVDAQGTFYILGRSSMDIIKSGGEKISALEIEKEILGLDEISECAVVGLPSAEWGEQVAAVVKVSEGINEDSITTEWLKKNLRDSLSSYKIPKIVKVVSNIPRNQMGKVNKKTLKKEIFPEYF